MPSDYLTQSDFVEFISIMISDSKLMIDKFSPSLLKNLQMNQQQYFWPQVLEDLLHYFVVGLRPVSRRISEASNSWIFPF